MPSSNEHVNLSQLKTLCVLKDGTYVSKTGKDYIRALSQVFEQRNRNDKPFTVGDIKEQPLLSDFKFAGVKDFTKICKLKISPMTITNNRRKNEKIKAEDFTSDEAKSIFENATRCCVFDDM